MNTIASIFSDILDTLLGLFALFVMLRFILQLVKADFYNPISQAIVRLTSPVLVPLRRVIPGVAGLDMASLVLVLVITLVNVSITVALKGFNPLTNLGVILAICVFKMIASFANIFVFCMFLGIILSWVAPMTRHPAALLSYQIAEPMMAPFRKIIPPMGGIDISPIFVFLSLNIFTRLLAALGAMMGVPVHALWGLFILV